MVAMARFVQCVLSMSRIVSYLMLASMAMVVVGLFSSREVIVALVVVAPVLQRAFRWFAELVLEDAGEWNAPMLVAVAVCYSAAIVVGAFLGWG